MTTQTQGKGKKRNKEVTKLSLDEFNQTDAGEGYSVINLKTGLDWAEAMADYDRSSIVVPVVPRSQRGPDVDYDSLPDEPPFRASLYNIPMSVEEKDLRDRFFQGMEVKRIEMSKSTTTVEFNSKQDLYDALCKNGTMLKNRTIDVCPFGARPDDNRSDRYGQRGGSSYGDRGGRSEGGGFARMGDRGGYNDRGFNRGDRDSYSGFSRNRMDDGRRMDDSRGEEADNWRARPATVNRPQPPPLSQPPQPPQQNYQSRSYYQPRYSQYQNNQPPPSNHNQPPHSFQNDRPGPMSFSRQMGAYRSGGPSPPARGPGSDNEERPKLIINKRATPLNPEDLTAVKRNEAIFGQAKPSSKPYEKMKEVEEKLNS